MIRVKVLGLLVRLWVQNFEARFIHVVVGPVGALGPGSNSIVESRMSLENTCYFNNVELGGFS